MCAVGYTIQNYVIVRDSNRSYETRWKYNVYEYTGQGATRTSVNPCRTGFVSSKAPLLGQSHRGGEPYRQHHPHHLVVPIRHEYHLYPLGLFIGSRSQLDGNPRKRSAIIRRLNSFEWTVPNVDSNNSRVSIHGYGPPYMAGDGSYSNFSISYNRNLILPASCQRYRLDCPTHLPAMEAIPIRTLRKQATRSGSKPSGGSYSYFTVGQNISSYLKSNLVANKTYYWNVMAVGDDSNFTIPPGLMEASTASSRSPCQRSPSLPPYRRHHLDLQHQQEPSPGNSISCQNLSVKSNSIKGLSRNWTFPWQQPNDGSFDWTIRGTWSKGSIPFVSPLPRGRVVGKSNQFNHHQRLRQSPGPHRDGELDPQQILQYHLGGWRRHTDRHGQNRTVQGAGQVLDISTGTDIGPRLFFLERSHRTGPGIHLFHQGHDHRQPLSGQSGKFSIVAGIMEVRTPATGALWQRGVPHTITWVQVVQSFSPNVKIQLFRGTC